MTEPTLKSHMKRIRSLVAPENCARPSKLARKAALASWSAEARERRDFNKKLSKAHKVKVFIESREIFLA